MHAPWAGGNAMQSVYWAGNWKLVHAVPVRNKSHVKSVLILAKMSAGSQTASQPVRQTASQTAGSGAAAGAQHQLQFTSKGIVGDKGNSGGICKMQSVGNKLTKVVVVLPGLAWLGLALAMIKCLPYLKSR